MGLVEVQHVAAHKWRKVVERGTISDEERHKWWQGEADGGVGGYDSQMAACSNTRPHNHQMSCMPL